MTVLGRGEGHTERVFAECAPVGHFPTHHPRLVLDRRAEVDGVVRIRVDGGPEVTGTAEALLMAIAGRAAAVTDLNGSGVALLADHLGVPQPDSAASAG